VTTFDPKDVRSWSGTGYYMGKTLEDNFNDITYIGNLQESFKSIFVGKRVFYKYIFHRRYLSDRDPILLQNYANQIKKRLKNSDVDLIFSPATIPIAKLEISKPIVFWTDATFTRMVDFYPEFSNLCKQSIRCGNEMEKLALQRCSLAIYSSEWAAESAIHYYGIDEAKVKVLPFGANINYDISESEIKNLIENRSSEKCKLLFMGVDWTRKGGDIAIKVAEELNRSGLKTELTIVGCQPPMNKSLPSFIKVLGFVNDNERFDLFEQSHFLILPTRADCTPIVFCEANAFGVPCITTNVGGIPTVIKDDLNGKMFSIDADVKEYCRYIVDLFQNYQKYKCLSFSSFQEYQSRLNWSIAGKTLKELLLEFIR
jgi:glycosyltransferase involved in cell wall biosynthesis